MKKIIAVVSFAFATLSVQAQQDAISQYFSTLENDRSNTVITISGSMFKLLQNFDVDDAEDQEMVDAMSKLTGLKMLNKEDLSDGFTYYRNALKKLPKNTWSEWMTVREKDSDLSFWIREEGKMVTELLMVIGNENSFFLMSIIGDIDMNQISRISEGMDIEGLDELEKMDKKKKKDN